MSQRTETVVIFGAGATKACGGSLTNDILPHAFELQDKNSTIFVDRYFDVIRDFLQESFYLPTEPWERETFKYPPLPLLLSLIDTAIDRKDSMSARWNTAELSKVRHALEYLIFAVLEYDLRKIDGAMNFYQTFLDKLCKQENALTVISFNYDVIVDNALIKITGELPDYGCDIEIRNKKYRAGAAKLYKPHGSLNWMFCPRCQRLELAVSSESFSKAPGTYKALNLFSLENYYNVGLSCPNCNASFCPIMITPTHLKDYRNPHIARVWHQAGQALRRAGKVYVIGYSLPDDDLEVIYLLKQNLSGLDGDKITIVEYDPDDGPLEENATYQRCCVLFGRQLKGSLRGFAKFADDFDNATRDRRFVTPARKSARVRRSRP